LQRQHPARIRGYVAINPNYTAHALTEVGRCLAGAEGMIGIKLAASRRANDPLLDPICELARERGVPILHHIWQHRRRDWPGQEASDGPELAALAARHPRVPFILAHIAGGGDWEHTLAVLPDAKNVYVDLSGSGVDGGMLERCIEAAGVERLLWGCDLTMDTGWAKLRYLQTLLSPEDLEQVKWRNAARIFPRGAFPID
jgi:predicted TIM-barrel fold metal-dependent hydrolase